MSLAAGVSASLLTRIDRLHLVEVPLLSWLNCGEPDSVRALLSTIASSMISVATLSFSVTIVTLTIASSTFGSRIVYNFMRDRSSQCVLGVFVGTFVYSLIVLQSVRSGSAPFVPHLSVVVGLGLVLTSLGVLIFYIHHVAQAIQATHVIARVGRELQEQICGLLPEQSQLTEAGEVVEPQEFPHLLLAHESGTLQAIDADTLVGSAVQLNGCFKLECRPGNHVLAGTPVARYTGDRSLSREQELEIARAFVLGPRRTLVQDIELGFNQLVEIVVRALSPGINDPFTAVNCLDELSAALALVLSRDPQPQQVYDEDGELRLILNPSSFERLVHASFAQVRQNAADCLSVAIHLLEVVEKLIPLARKVRQVDALLHQAEQMHELAGQGSFLTDADRADLDERRRCVLKTVATHRATLASGSC